MPSGERVFIMNAVFKGSFQRTDTAIISQDQDNYSQPDGYEHSQNDKDFIVGQHDLVQSGNWSGGNICSRPDAVICR